MPLGSCILMVWFKLLNISAFIVIFPYTPRRPQNDNTMSIYLVTGSGCWLGDVPISNVEVHQFGGHQTFWPKHYEGASIFKLLTASINQEHLCNGPPMTTALADANFGGAVLDLAYSGGIVLSNGI